jgi:chromosome segregation ATPase
LEVNNMTTTVVGPRSEKIIEEVERLEAAHIQVAQEVEELAQQVGEKEDKLSRARAAGVIEKVGRDVIAAFESELTALQNQLEEKRFALAGLDQLLAEKAEKLAAAQIADAQEALLTDQMREALAGLKENAEALDKTRATILQLLESRITALLEELEPHHQRWKDLIIERQDLYISRYKALGKSANMGDSAYHKMLKDRHAKLLSGNGQEASEVVVTLAEFLRPLVAEGRGR